MRLDKIIPVDSMKEFRQVMIEGFSKQYKEQCIKSINEQIFQTGTGEYAFLQKAVKDKLTKDMHVAIAKELEKEYRENGYNTTLIVNGQSNKEKDCTLLVWIREA
jgi:Flp pilus assembly CpaF family ATPase